MCTVKLPDVREHFSALFNRPGDALFDISADARYYTKFPADITTHLSIPITDEEVCAALGQMNASSNPGVFGLDVKCLRMLTKFSNICDFLVDILNKWISGEIGDELLLTLLTAIPKADRDPTVAKNLRPISVTSIWYRLV